MSKRSIVGALALLLVAAGLVIPPSASAAVPLVPDDTWGADGRVLCILRAGGSVFLGGEFTALVPDDGPGVTRNHMGALDAATGQPTAFNPNINGNVDNMALSPDGSVLYVVGLFTTVGTASRKNIAAFDVSTGALLPWQPVKSPNKLVQAVATLGSTVYVGGGFTKVGTAVRTRLAAFDANTAALLPWAPAANKGVRDIVALPSRIYVAGLFVQMNGVNGRSLSALNPTTGAVISGVYHPGYPIVDLEVSGTRLFGAGGGAGGRALGASVSTGAKIWEMKTDGNVQGVGIEGSSVFFGGHFFKYNNKAVSQLVRVDPTNGALDQSWLPTSNGFLGVFAVDGFGSHLYIGGDFDHVSAQKQLHFAQFTDPQITNDADISVSVSGSPDPATVGQDLTYSIQVSNSGPDIATGTQLTDVLPANTSFVSASSGCSYVSSTRTVSCSVGVVSVGVTVPVSIVVAPGSSGTLNNTVSVDAIENDPVLSNNSATASTAVQGVPGVDMHLTVVAPTTLNVGDQYSYAFTMTNQGADPATAVSFADLLPNDVSFVSSASSQGSCSGQSTVTCSLGAMAVGNSATVTITVTAPANPMTLTNDATVSDAAFDPDSNDNAITTYTTVRIASSDTTPPAATGAQMFDDDHDGKVDRAVVTFAEPLATCPAPCTVGWSLTDVPSDGHLVGVSTSGNQASLAIGEGGDDPDTDVGLFRISLASPNAIQDAAGNHATVTNLKPADAASPVPVAFRQGHPSTGSCAGSVSTAGVAEVCDTLTAEWSEALDPASLPSTTSVTIQDPAGAGNDQIIVPFLFAAPLDGGSDGYVTQDDTSATWASSVVLFSGPAGSDYLTVRISGSCTGDGCGFLGAGPKITVTYIPSSSIRDLAGNVAAGQFVKSQKITLF